MLILLSSYGDWFELIKDFLVQWGHLGLAIYTVIETLLIIPPIEIILTPLVLSNPSDWLIYSLNAIFFTFFASALGYYIGMKIGYPILTKITSKDLVDKAHNLFDKYGVLAVAIVGFTPIPYTIVVFLAGISKMNFIKYMISAMIARSSRFIIVSYFVSKFIEAGSKAQMYYAIIGGAIIILYFIVDTIIKKYKKSKQEVSIEK